VPFRLGFHVVDYVLAIGVVANPANMDIERLMVWQLYTHETALRLQLDHPVVRVAPSLFEGRCELAGEYLYH
jgi:hypothetical protein